jgi:3-methyladenine DNA glycosylase AlkD
MDERSGGEGGLRALNAERFIARLEEHRSTAELEKIRRYFKAGKGEYAEGDLFIGVRMGTVFELAKEFVAMPLPEIERLLDSEIHEARAGALKIMARQAGAKRTSPSHRQRLYELYLRRHDRINNWDLVDLAAWDVVGRHLYDGDRSVLLDLARSANLWERRTAMLSTLFFVRQGDLDDAYRIAEVLIADEHDLIHKAVGGMLREAGKHDRPRLLAFLDEHAASMPRTALRYATEHLDKPQRTHYLSLKDRP